MTREERELQLLIQSKNAVKANLEILLKERQKEQ